MFEVALLFERGYLCLSAVAYVVAQYSRTTIVNVLPYEVSVESEGERETAAAQAAHRRGSTVGFEFEVGLFVVCLFVSTSRQRRQLDRAAEGESPRRRFPPFEEAWLQLWQCEGCYFVWGNVIEVEEFYDRGEPS